MPCAFSFLQSVLPFHMSRQSAASSCRTRRVSMEVHNRIIAASSSSIGSTILTQSSPLARSSPFSFCIALASGPWYRLHPILAAVCTPSRRSVDVRDKGREAWRHTPLSLTSTESEPHLGKGGGIVRRETRHRRRGRYGTGPTLRAARLDQKGYRTYMV